MRIVVDTNVLFSLILNSNGLIGELIFNAEDEIEFFSPEFIVYELTKYKEKLQKLSGVSLRHIEISIYQSLKHIRLISPEAISKSNWELAYDLTRDVDENDTPFVATALGVYGSIWTGDKKLIIGLRDKGFTNIYNTKELAKQVWS